MGGRSRRLPDKHFLVRSTSDGWYVCMCGCGYVAVCEHCVPHASVSVPRCSCKHVQAEQERLDSLRYGR